MLDMVQTPVESARNEAAQGCSGCFWTNREGLEAACRQGSRLAGSVAALVGKHGEGPRRAKTSLGSFVA